MSKTFKIITTLALILASTSFSHAQWSIVGSAGITGAVANHTKMVVDNNDNPYIAFADNSNGDKLSVKKWNGSSWQNIGTAISNSSIQYMDISIDQSNNDIYVAYKDWSKSGKLTVQMYNGSSWSTVGSAGFTSSSVDYISTTVYNGVIFVAYKDNNRGGKATCAYYYKGTWYPLGSVGFTSTSVTYVSVEITPDGYGYIACRDNSNRPMAYEWTSNGWSSLGTANSSGVSDVTLAVDTNNVPYIAYIDWNNSSKLTVKKHSGNSWSTVGSAGVSPNSIGSPDIAIDPNSNQPYVVYRDNNHNQKASVMAYNGSAWSNVGSAGFTSNTVDYTSLVIDGKGTLYVGYKDNAVGQKATVMKYSGGGGQGGGFNGVTWDGSQSSDWGTAANWSGNATPTSKDDVLIPAGLSRYPDVKSNQYMYCKDITIQKGASLTINSSGAYLLIYGDIVDSGSTSVPAGGLAFLGSTAQIISSVNNIETDVLLLYNNNGLTLKDTVIITDMFNSAYGTLKTNDKLVLKSTAKKTARVQGSSGGNYINGKVTVQQYIPGNRRAYRFFSHPFSSSIPLSQLIDDIDITGQGGATNGFTTVQVNAPSAFWFDVTTADTSTTGNNPGWKDFTSANTSSWEQYEMARIMCRGSKGQGLTPGSYTPNAVTLDMTGDINQGNKTLTYNKGSNSDFIICGNPYPSQVNLKHVGRSNVGANFCVWDPHQGTFGGYTSHQFSSDYILPAYSAFVTEVTSGSSGRFYFEENDKVSNTPKALFKGDPIEINRKYEVELRVEDNDIFWDRLLIEFDSSATAKQDDNDMLKFYNPDLDVYTLMDDSTRISIDVRPYESGKTVPVGIVGYEKMRLAIRVPKYHVPDGAKLYLHDKKLNKKELIKEGYEYWFDIDDQDASTMGTRFEVIMGEPTGIISSAHTIARAQMQVYPNPAQEQVNIALKDLPGETTLNIISISGKVMYKQNITDKSTILSIPLNGYPSGMYIVELSADSYKTTRKLIVQ